MWDLLFRDLLSGALQVGITGGLPHLLLSALYVNKQGSNEN